MSRPPALSVVVALISGDKDHLRRCLEWLHAQTLAPMEIIVPYDEPCAGDVALQTDFPDVRFLPERKLDTRTARAGASREHHDTLRTVGIRAAKGELIALTEDHEYGDKSWCEELVAALDRYAAAGASGGAVECDSGRALNWAVWFCDFGRYQNPLPEGRAEFASDSNVLYRRTALEAVAHAWQHDYHEPSVHRAMADAGFELCTTPRGVVWQARGRLRLGPALRERYVWGRSFAGTRAQMIGSTRWALALLSPLLPLVLTWRIARTTFQRGRHTRRLVACLPLILLLQSVWALGELVGYVTAKR